MKMVIDKNVPIPTGKPRQKYPWDEMAVGDSFVMPYDQRRGGVGSAAKMSGVKVMTRKEGDKLRVWRIA